MKAVHLGKLNQVLVGFKCLKKGIIHLFFMLKLCLLSIQQYITPIIHVSLFLRAHCSLSCMSCQQVLLSSEVYDLACLYMFIWPSSHPSYENTVFYNQTF